MNFDNIKWNEKGLIPAVIQDDVTSSVLMLGYMNQDSLNKSLKSNEVTFFSRSKNRLWTKGEESGNKLIIKNIILDCDRDTLLIQATPLGPTCHTGTISCFGNDHLSIDMIQKLESIIDERRISMSEGSYISSLFKKGVKEIAKKVNEEAGETAIAAVTNDGRLIEEAADLVFHLMVLLRSQDKKMEDVTDKLFERSTNQ
ncbi:MAG: bifunctional phosphoribosyl-AMP cyclohydrolase/phosphoribosyl-ATP diphosphatase HisIE [Candidatus Marinimicrobia bacterium]|jgi:phosphoribosyl-ATP pyrophosphohydrolase/phosphoribosyl-AMP cyclohydrolase|nr:bifunctional phosphoribosyl-AMP cyclohydrolase/phosphoribosyl-ATP diphosphatase HisIE [Candidatus Neomarinimicrobiota bacterium]MBT7524300.1 bifunctional phosphoribosyl-AMP cyclohydrolase/phosphoribosyl-ATP diphosphatase HisIE [Candidatus Neomarinimicrobiota bacterium]MDA9321878.1 bifunctional phosphoribosyl-AMP cyclohydrolase/phosphoribosyl-ATP diphosphatase HisIE [Gammaproteobacteria bacterium]